MFPVASRPAPPHFRRTPARNPRRGPAIRPRPTPSAEATPVLTLSRLRRRPARAVPASPLRPDPGLLKPGLLKPGRNVWRATAANRAAVLSDGAAYFGALRETMLNARRSIHVAGWDIDSRMPLMGEAPPTDGLPDTLGPFLSALTERNPDLTIRLLLWDYSVLYAMERELLPILALRWNTPSRVELCLDGETPFGASHHQKFAVVDDRVAFCGGLDLTIRRWDTKDHAPDDPRRVDPAGTPYPPFHDVQMAVDGEAAATLAALFRARWLRASGETLPPMEAAASPAPHDPWPASVPPDLRDVAVGIARTRPERRGPFGHQSARREVEALVLDMIARAERTIYLENQFLTCGRVARAIVRRMRRRPGLEAVLIAPKTHHSWLEHRTMLAGRIRFARRFAKAGLGDRVRLLHPQVTGATSESEVMVHAKVLAVDDRWLRVGSSNLCNRSMGLDTECDLVIEARTAEDRAALARMRDRLVGEHLGLTAAAVGERVARTGSLIAAIAEGGADGHALHPIDDGRGYGRDLLSRMETAADPVRPMAAAEYLADFLGHPDAPPRSGRMAAFLLRAAVMILPIALLILLWRVASLDALLDPGALGDLLETGAGWGPLGALALFLLLGFVAFPVNLLILGTAAAFGTWPGLLYAGLGAMASAVATYWVGRRLGTEALRRWLGPRTNRVAAAVNRGGILAVTTIRLLPIAPFTLVNLVAGALRVRFIDYVAGTALGLLPGIALLSLAGDGVARIVADPTPRNLGLLAAFVAAWAGATWGLQRLLSRRRDATRPPRATTAAGTRPVPAGLLPIPSGRHL